MDNHVTELIPSFVLGSLDEEERLVVDRHIRTCEICVSELRAYTEVMGELAYAVPSIEPAPHLKQQIMSKIRSKEAPAQNKSGISFWQRFVNFSRNAAPAWALTSLLLILVLGAGNLLMLNRIKDLDKAQPAANLGVINLNGTEVTPDATGIIVVSKDGEHGTLIVDRLPVLDEAQQYQLWLIMDGERESGGVFSVSDDGYGSLWVRSPAPLVSFSSFGITIEPKGGSPGPTGEKVLGSDV